MVENMLIWHVVIHAQFRCVALVLAASHQNFVMSDHRKNFFRWLLSVLFCCWNSSNSFTDNIGDRRICALEHVEMGPLTLRDYINTLEPYDPEKHGWRGEEPWRYRIRYKELPIQSTEILSEFKIYAGETSKRDGKIIRLAKFEIRGKAAEKKKPTTEQRSVISNDKTIRQPSIHQLRQTINLLQIILLKLSGIEITNLKP